MTTSKGTTLGIMATLITLGLALSGVNCGITFAPLPKGAVVGRAGVYNYSPSVIESGNLQQFWWCGQDDNPKDRAQLSDSIQYESIDLSTHATSGPMAVLTESPQAWDALYTCNPKVIRGSFDNPLDDGRTYTYAMYYVGTSGVGNNNSIGVAFSNDGMRWKKYPRPVILSTSKTGYGVGQPAVYNSDQRSGIWMFYEDDTPVTHHVEAVSTDGVHFTVQGTLTTHGLEPYESLATWGDMAYDPETDCWYAVFDRPLRRPSTTGGILERGQYGVVLYRIPNGSLLTGATPWQELETVDTNLTGYEANFIAGFLRDPYGNLNVGPYPTIRMYPSISTPPPAWNASPAAAGSSGDVSKWVIASASWVPNQPLLSFNRYFNNTVHEVTTGWVDPNGGFSLQSTLGHLDQSPQEGATLAFYGCKDGSTDYFVSLDFACEGKRVLGTEGYGYSQPVAGLNLVALYRCATSQDHFVSKDPACEGQGAGELLGYVLP